MEIVPSKISPTTVDLIRILDLNLETGPWLAGGAVLNMVQGQNIGNDLDVWFASQAQLEVTTDKVLKWIYAELKKHPNFFMPLSFDHVTYRALLSMPDGNQFTKFGDVYSSLNAVSVRVTSLEIPTIQLIRKRFYSSVNDIFNSFDISVCQFATDGRIIVHGKDALQHAKERQFEITRVHPELFKRFAKYYAKGYDPTEQAILTMHQEAARINWEYETYDRESYNEVG